MKVTTTRCRVHGHREFVLEFDPSAVIRTDISWLVQLLEGSVAAGSRYEPGETLRVGWADVRIEAAEDDYLTLLEPDWTGALPLRYVKSVTKALVHLRRQKDVADSLGLSDRLAFPTIRQSGIVCTQIDTRPCGVMDRGDADARDSGWFFGCDDSEHDHNNAAFLKRVSLYEVACHAPGTAQFCALPPGVSISFGGQHVLTVRVGDEPATIAEGSYLDQLLLQADGSLGSLG